MFDDVLPDVLPGGHYLGLAHTSRALVVPRIGVQDCEEPGGMPGWGPGEPVGRG
jgi:hypothetical protein